MKKLSICFAFVLMFCLMLSGCTTQFEGTWELSSYLATINNLEFEYTFEEVEELVVNQGDNLTDEQKAENFVVSMHQMTKDYSMRFSGNKVVLTIMGVESETDFTYENNIISITTPEMKLSYENEKLYMSEEIEGLKITMVFEKLANN